MKKNIFLLLITLFLSFPTWAGGHFNKVVIIVFENTDYSNVLQQPYFKELTNSGALLTNYKALTHPSQPNYIAMIAGSMLGVKDDQNVDLKGNHIGDTLEQYNLDWKVYAEGFPGNCFTGARQGKYARKHVPFMSFINVNKNPVRCANITDSKQFFKDAATSSLPAYSLFIPNLDDDAHDTNISTGDKWLKTNFGPLFNGNSLPKDLLVVITFDEGSYLGNNQIYTLLLGGQVKPGTKSSKSYNAYNLLHTIETEFKIPDLGKNDATAALIDDVWP
jgi:hypothetical protein